MDTVTFTSQARDLVARTFAGVPRPGESVRDPDHCLECEEHAATLRANTLESLSFDHVGNPCWSPVCFMSDEGFRYWFPALARIASEREYPEFWGWIFGNWLAPEVGRQSAFTVQEQQVILQVFDWLLEVPLDDDIDFAFWADAIRTNAEAWRANLDQP